jgi:hypothetical protein
VSRPVEGRIYCGGGGALVSSIINLLLDASAYYVGRPTGCHRTPEQVNYKGAWESEKDVRVAHKPSKRHRIVQ